MFFLLAGIFFANNSVIEAKASSKIPTREQLFLFMKNTDKIQESMNETYTREQVHKKLSAFCTSAYIDRFIKYDMRYETYVSQSGHRTNLLVRKETDMTYYYIIGFSYTSKTKVSYSKDKTKIYVSEFIDDDEWYDPYTQIVTFINTKSGWRINELVKKFSK